MAEVHPTEPQALQGHPRRKFFFFFFFSQDLITKAWNRIRAMHKQDATQSKLNLAVNVKWEWLGEEDWKPEPTKTETMKYNVQDRNTRPPPQALGSNHPSQSRSTNPSAEVEERWHITLFPPHKETNAALESDGSLPEKLKKVPPASS